MLKHNCFNNFLASIITVSLLCAPNKLYAKNSNIKNLDYSMNCSVTYYISSEVYKSQNDTKNYEISLEKYKKLEYDARNIFESSGRPQEEFENEMQRVTNIFTELAIEKPDTFMAHKRMCDKQYHGTVNLSP